MEKGWPGAEDVLRRLVPYCEKYENIIKTFIHYLINPSKTLFHSNIHSAEANEYGGIFIAAVDVACLVSWSVLHQGLGISVFQAAEDATGQVIVAVLDAGVSKPWRLKHTGFTVVLVKIYSSKKFKQPHEGSSAKHVIVLLLTKKDNNFRQ